MGPGRQLTPQGRHIAMGIAPQAGTGQQGAIDQGGVVEPVLEDRIAAARPGPGGCPGWPCSRWRRAGPVRGPENRPVPPPGPDGPGHGRRPGGPSRCRRHRPRPPAGRRRSPPDGGPGPGNRWCRRQWPDGHRGSGADPAPPRSDGAGGRDGPPAGAPARW